MLLERKFISQYTAYLIVGPCNHSNRWLTKTPSFVTGCSGLAKDVAGCLNFHRGSCDVDDFLLQDFEKLEKPSTKPSQTPFHVDEM